MIRDVPKFTLLIFSVVFFFIYFFSSSLFSFQDENFFRGKSYQIFNQPDEGINYFFIRQLAFEKQFGAFESYSAITGSLIHPRSTTVIHETIVPIGFPGFIALLGIFTSIFAWLGESVFHITLFSIIPLVASITPLLFFAFLKNIFSRSVAFLSSLFLFLLPAWWYLASRPLQYMPLFLFFLVAALLLGKRAFEAEREKNIRKANLSWILSGTMVGISLVLRPSEIVWVLGGAFLCYLFLWKKISKSSVVLFPLGVGIAALIGLFIQYQFYGSPFASGYVVPQTDGSGGSIFSVPFLQYIFPFGLHISNIVKTLFHYGFGLFGMWSVGALLGMMFFLKREKQLTPTQIYLVIFALLSLYIMLVYGSWYFADNVFQKTSIGSSQVRYFLPILVFSLPFFATFFEKFFLSYRNRKILGGGAFLLLVLSSVLLVYPSFEGLQHIKSITHDYAAAKNTLLSLTEQESVIITRYGDKYLFPDRKIMTGFGHEAQKKAIDSLLAENIPVYIFEEKNKIDEFQNILPASFFLSERIVEEQNQELRKVLKK